MHEQLKKQIKEHLGKAGKSPELKSFLEEIDKTYEECDKIKQDEEIYHTIFDNSPESIAVLDKMGRIERLNNKIFEWLGYEKSEVIGKSIITFPFLPMKSRLLAVKNFIKRMAGADIAPYPLEFKTKNGEKKVGRIYASPIRDEKGKAIKDLIMMSDITAEVKAQEELIENQEIVKGVLESTADGILAIDSESKVIASNNRFAEMWKIPEKLIEARDDKKLLDYVLDQLKDPDSFIKKVNELYASTESSTDVLYFKDGRVFDRFSHPLLRGEKIVGRVWSFTDVTESKQAEDRLRDIVSNSGDWVWEVNAKMEFTYISGKLKEILGYDSKELIGKTPLTLMPEEEAKRVGEIAQSLFSKKEPVIDLENWNLHKNGKKVCFLTNGVPILDEKSNLVGYRGVNKDITKRKNAEKGIKESEEKFKLLFEEAPIGLYYADLKGIFVYGNKKAEEIVGYKRDELIGKNFLQTGLLLDPPGIAKAAKILLKNKLGKSTGPDELVLNRTDGTKRIVEIYTNIITLGNQKVIFGMADDITDKKEAESTILSSKEELAEKNQRLEDMNAHMIGRETKMIELKNEIKKLKSQQGN